MLLSGISLQSIKRRKRYSGRDAPASDGVVSRNKKMVS
jgi:hypothetical protein